MERATIEIYKETIPKYYVGADCSIIIKYKCEEFEADLIADAIKTILEGINHEVTIVPLN